MVYLETFICRKLPVNLEALNDKQVVREHKNKARHLGETGIDRIYPNGITCYSYESYFVLRIIPQRIVKIDESTTAGLDCFYTEDSKQLVAILTFTQIPCLYAQVSSLWNVTNVKASRCGTFVKIKIAFICNDQF